MVDQVQQKNERSETHDDLRQPRVIVNFRPTSKEEVIKYQKGH
jgi:hypothetical protein